MEDRELILSKLPKAGRTSRPPLRQPPIPRDSHEELWLEFGTRLAELGGKMGTRQDVEAMLLLPHLLDHEAADLLGLPNGGEDVWEAEVGISTADIAVAETGSLILATSASRTRLISLCPPMHVAIVPRDRIVATLAEAFSTLSDRTTVMITGPSRTADIEGVLVRGVHGPGQIMVVPW